MTTEERSAALEETLDEVLELDDDEARGRFFERNGHLVEVDYVARISSEVASLLKIDLRKAQRLAETARWLSRTLDDQLAIAFSERATAYVRHLSGDIQEAQKHYDSAVEAFVKLGDEHEAAVARYSALPNLAYLGHYDRVHEWAQLARSTFQELNDRRRLAALDANYANILYRQDRWEEALEKYQSAHREFVDLRRAREAAMALRNIAVCHISLHNFEEALRTNEQAREHCIEHGLTRLVREIDYNIAYLYYLRGEYTRAIHLYQETRRFCVEEGDAYHRALCDLDQSELYLELNLVEEAEELARSAFISFETLHMPYELAKSLTNLAIALSRKDQGFLALDLLRQARDIFVREENRLWPALIDLYQALVLYREGRSFEAIRLATQARQAFSDAALAPKAAMCDLLLSRLHLEAGRPEEARARCMEALTKLPNLDLPALEHQAYLVLGQVEEEQNSLEAAFTAYQESNTRLERLRSHLQREDLKIAFLEDKKAVYDSLFTLCLQGLGGEESRAMAFDFIEKAKSRSLADLLAFRTHSLPSRVAGESQLAQRVRQLREELNWYYRQLDLQQLRAIESYEEGTATLRSRARLHEDELLRTLRELQAADQEYGSLQAGVTVSIDELQGSLSNESTLIEYFVARDTVYAAVVERDRWEIVPLTTAERARRLYRLLQFQLTKFRLGDDYVSRHRKLIDEATTSHLKELYDELIGPIAHLLKNPELVVVPHLFLHYVPFHALVDGENHLIDRFRFSYAPSGTVFHLCAQRKSRTGSRSLILAVADEAAPEILEEAKAVADALPGADLFVGEEATEEVLRELASGCRIVHIATHGLFRHDNPMFSALQLGTSRLSLFDLYHLDLSAEMVVLSGCGTGLSAVVGADELVGLTRGLLYAGAQSAVVTLWDVHDRSASMFMSALYRHLGSGLGRANALQETIFEVRERYPHPYFWAPFILVGSSTAPET